MHSLQCTTSKRARWEMNSTQFIDGESGGLYLISLGALCLCVIAHDEAGREAVVCGDSSVKPCEACLAGSVEFH